MPAGECAEGHRGDCFGVAGEVAADAAIDSQLEQILNADRGAVFAVLDANGEIIGALTRQVVVDLLASPPRQT